ncbi:hypothetical protein LXL04_029283 [Taraxacum kok-saghyz]
MNDGRRESYLPLIEASLYQNTESRSWNSRSRDGIGAKIEIESLLVKSRLGINGIKMESVIDCWERRWERLRSCMGSIAEIGVLHVPGRFGGDWKHHDWERESRLFERIWHLPSAMESLPSNNGFAAYLQIGRHGFLIKAQTLDLLVLNLRNKFHEVLIGIAFG